MMNGSDRSARSIELSAAVVGIRRQDCNGSSSMSSDSLQEVDCPADPTSDVRLEVVDETTGLSVPEEPPSGSRLSRGLRKLRQLVEYYTGRRAFAPLPSDPAEGQPKGKARCFGMAFLDSWDQIAVFFAYIGLYLLYSAWVHDTQGISYSPTMMILSVLMTKLAVSYIAYLLVDGSTRTLFRTLVEHRKHISLFCFPAFAYATTDSLGVFCLRRIDPATFAILYNSRTVFICILFQYFMKVPLQKPQWIAISLIVSACIIKEVPNLTLFAAASDVLPLTATVTPDDPTAGIVSTTAAALQSKGGDVSRLWTAFLVVVMGNLAAFAAVFSEKLLKDQQNLSLNVQNIAMYGWATIACIIYSVLLPMQEKGLSNLLSDLGSSEMWITIWTYPIVIAVMLSAIYGLVTSLFIKSLNSIIREIATGIYIVSTIPLNAFFFHYAVKWTDLCSVAVVIAGVTVYNRTPVRAAPPPSSSSTVPK